MALFDRIHSIRVKAIQEEYQRYMERVRTKAQNAIDQANTSYQQSRSMLTARVDTLVHYLQNRHLHVSIPFAALSVCSPSTVHMRCAVSMTPPAVQAWSGTSQDSFCWRLGMPA